MGGRRRDRQYRTAGTRNLSFAAKKLLAFSTASSQLFEDSALFEQTLRDTFSKEFGFLLYDAIVNGSGVGMPLGVLASPSLITVTAAEGQAAGSLLGDNINAMWAALPAPMRNGAAWLCHESDIEPQPEALVGKGELSHNTFMPAGTNGSPVQLLKGRPLLAIEQAWPAGTPGDLILAHLPSWILIDGGLVVDVSVENRFLTDELVLRFRWRGDGQPAYSSPVTAHRAGYNASPRIVSPFIALASRT